MARSGMRQDQVFWQIVKGMQWKLDDGQGGPPPNEPEFEHGGCPARTVPMWSTHVLAFVIGALTFGFLLTAPAMVPLLAVTTAGAVCARHVLYRR